MRIEYHGDSVQAGGGTLFHAWHLLQYILNEQKPGAGHVVTSKAIGGSSAAGSMHFPQAVYGNQTFPEYIATAPVDVVIANWGINDAGQGTMWTFAADHRIGWDHCAVRGIPYLPETATPVLLPELNALLNLYTDCLRQQAAFWNKPIIDTRAMVCALPWQSMMNDQVHPNAEIQWRKAWLNYKRLCELGIV